MGLVYEVGDAIHCRLERSAAGSTAYQRLLGHNCIDLERWPESRASRDGHMINAGSSASLPRSRTFLLFGISRDSFEKVLAGLEDAVRSEMLQTGMIAALAAFLPAWLAVELLVDDHTAGSVTVWTVALGVGRAENRHGRAAGGGCEVHRTTVVTHEHARLPADCSQLRQVSSRA